MKTLALVALSCLPVAAFAQTAQTTCYPTAPTAPPASQSVTCSTYVTSGTQPSQPPRQYVNPNAASDAFDRAVQMGQRQEALRQQTEVAAAQRRNLELQNELLKRQLEQPQPGQADALLAAETAVVRHIYTDVLAEQRSLPEAQRLSPDALKAHVLERSTAELGHAPSDLAYAQAVVQCLFGCAKQ